MWVIPVLWAGAFLTGSSALHRLSSDMVTFLRFAVAAAGGIIVLRGPWLSLLRARPSGRAWMAIGFLALVGGVLYHVLFYLGLARSEPPIASVVIATNPMLTTLGCAIFLRDRRPTASLFAGLALAFAGTIALAADRPAPDGAASSFVSRAIEGWGLGETLCLSASLCWAVFAVSMQHFRVGMLKGLPSAGITYCVYLLTAMAMLPCVLLTGSADEITIMTPGDWGCMLYLGLLSTVVAYTMYNSAIDRVGSARVSQVTYAVPTLTTLLSIVFGSFRPGALTIVGLAIVTLGLLISDGRLARRIAATFT